MRDKVRIGAVSYLNTRPLVFGMQQGLGSERVDLDFDVPSVLAERMAAGEIDVALLPIIELARIPDLELIPGLGIATRGASRSVLLVARRPLDELRSIALDPESRTSNALIRVLCANVWGVHPEFRPAGCSLEAALASCDAAVRIGDKALFESPATDNQLHDLGQVWTEATGLPFVFAAWIARRGVVDRQLCKILRDSYDAGSRAIETIAGNYDRDGHRDADLARRYLTDHIRFELGEEEMQGIRAFFDAAFALDLIGSVPRLEAPVEAARLSELRP